MTENPTTDTVPAGRVRRIALTSVAAVATFLTAVLTMGSLGLVVGGQRPDGVALTPDDTLAYLVHVPWLALGWGAAFVALLWRAADRPAAVQQALGMLVGLYISGLVLAGENDPVFYIGFGLVVLLLAVLHPTRRAVWRPGPDGISAVLLPLALLVAAPCTLYALEMVDRYQAGGPDGPYFLSIAVTALTVPLVGIAAALRAPGWRLPLWVTGGMLFLLVGTGAAAEPSASAAPPTAWAAAGLLTAVAFVALGEWEAQRLARGRRAVGPAESAQIPVLPR